MHHLLNDNKLVFLSLDLETGGENCGIIQLSAEIVRIKMQRGGQGPEKDSISSVQRGEGVYNEETNTGGTTFNEYVNPGDDAEWNEAACVHGLTSSSPCIQSAREIGQVWPSFSKFVEDGVRDDKEICLVAYNGAASDMKWIWRLTQSPAALFALPPNIKWFLDPLMVIREYDGARGCKINPKHSGLDALKLGKVWAFLNDGMPLLGAHDSMVDARAQTDILTHPFFAPFIDRKKSVVPVEEIFAKKQLRELMKELEATHPVHPPWVELSPDDDFSWSRMSRFAFLCRAFVLSKSTSEA